MILSVNFADKYFCCSQIVKIFYCRSLLIICSGFPRWESQLQTWGCLPIFGQTFPKKTAWIWKKLDPEGACIRGAHLDPPMGMVFWTRCFVNLSFWQLHQPWKLTSSFLLLGTSMLCPVTWLTNNHQNNLSVWGISVNEAKCTKGISTKIIYRLSFITTLFTLLFNWIPLACLNSSKPWASYFLISACWERHQLKNRTR